MVAISDISEAQRTQLNALRADITAVRTALIAALVKLDADGGVTDTNYAATLTPAAISALAITRE